MTTPADAAREWLLAQNCEFGREPTERREAEASLARLIEAREREAYLRGVEDAAKVCDARRPSVSERMNDRMALEHDMEAYLCAAAIRALAAPTAARRADSARGET
jgi:hypothetical protein